MTRSRTRGAISGISSKKLFKMAASRALIVLTALLPTAAAFSTTTPPSGLRVCKNVACKKAGSLDTLDSLFALATTSDEANAAASRSGGSLVALQAAFAASRIQSAGCLEGCGNGPNVVTTDATGPEDVFHDVYKPASCVALLEHIGIHVPDAAKKAWLRRMYAMRAMRSNKHAEAIALLTEGLQEASVLKSGAAHLLQQLLELRADVYDQLRDAEKAAADRKRAAGLRSMVAETAASAK